MKTYTQMKSIQNFNKKALLGALVAAGMTMASTGVYAVTGDMNTSATLASACTISTSTLAFNSIVAMSTTAEVRASTADLMVACSAGSNPLIYSTTARILTGAVGTTSAGGSIAFNLSQTAGGSDLPIAAPGQEILTPWAANGTPNAVVIHGSIPTANFSGQPVGGYSAKIVLSVDYS